MAADVDVVLCTAFRALTMLWYPEYRDMIERGHAPFTTIIIDEAGLVSRAATAVLSLLGFAPRDPCRRPETARSDQSDVSRPPHVTGTLARQ